MSLRQKAGVEPDAATSEYHAMTCTLIVYALSIQSSYAEDSETTSDQDGFDTVQFFIGPEASWRMRTFSIDEDVHVYSLGATKADTIDTVCASTERTYADVIAARHEFHSDKGIEGLKEALAGSDLGATVEESERHGFIFWVPEGTEYRTRSTPEA